MVLPKNAKDLTGQRFGRLLAVEPLGSDPGKVYYGIADATVADQKSFLLPDFCAKRRKAAGALNGNFGKNRI